MTPNLVDLYAGDPTITVGSRTVKVLVNHGGPAAR